jgi:uncharacterized protein (DUF4415 family)
MTEIEEILAQMRERLEEEEDARITAAAESDPDNPPLTEEDFARARPADEVIPEFMKEWRRTRGKQKAPTKQLVSLRLDRDVLDHFKRSGPGWQSRINAALRKAMGG